MKRTDLEQTYQRNEQAARAASAAIQQRVAAGGEDPDPFDTPDGLPDLPDEEDGVVAELVPPRKAE